MRRLALAALLSVGLAAGCASVVKPVDPAVPVELGAPPSASDISSEGDLVIGVVADTQIQTNRAHRPVQWYKGKLEDRLIPVALRPPALDWSSRAILWSQLQRLRGAGAQAVFYLGDGANNGCADEVSGELAAPQVGGSVLTQGGILKILDAFSREAGVPVFFVLGNHDLLGGGNTSDRQARVALCDDVARGGNRPLTKLEVMELADTFNRGMTGRFPGWTYESNLASNGPATFRQCAKGMKPKRELQQRAWGCYLAARVRWRGRDAATTEFLLLDTNDFAEVTGSQVAHWEFEGQRGAMSFGPARAGLPSQTSWFADAATPVAVRVGLSHYDLPSLRKNLFGIPLSLKSQRLMDLFVDPTGRPRQSAAWFISGHTHVEANSRQASVFSTKCGLLTCTPGHSWTLHELNVGSTTDFGNEAALVRISAGGDGAPPSLRTTDMAADRSGCPPVWRAIAEHRFPRAVRGVTTGWGALGVSLRAQDYQTYGETEHADVAANLASFVREPPQAVCIGLKAAAVEKGRTASLVD